MASAFAVTLASPAAAERTVAFLGPLVPAGQLAGSWALVRGPAPPWLGVGALGLGLVGVAGVGLPLSGLEPWLGYAVEPAGSLAAAGLLLVLVRRDGASPALLAVVGLQGGLAVLDALSAHARLTAGAFPSALLYAWAASVLVGLPLQLHLASQRLVGRQLRLRHRAEEELRHSRERFEALCESAFDLVAELDGEERFTYVNPRYEEVLGHPREALIGTLCRHLIHPEDQRVAREFAERAAARGTAAGLVLRARHRSGSHRWLESVARSFVTSEGERRWVLNSRDVTQRRAAEETLERARERLEETVVERTVALHASEARFRALADHAPELISEFDAQGRYLFANASFRELLGREPSDLIGRTPDALIHPEDEAASRRGMIRAFRREGAAHAVHRLRHADGSWRWFDNTGRAYRTAQGELRFVSIGRDVTEARREEARQRRLEAHLHEVQRLESLGVLAGGIAHDFNNLLAVILGNVALLESSAERASGDASRLRRIRAAARHAEGLTEQMLTYAGRAVSKLRPLDLSGLVRDTEELLHAAVSKKVRLEVALEPGLPSVEGDATQLRQVLLNLVSNASEALGEAGGTVRVRTATCTVDRGWLTDTFGSGEPAPGRYAVLEVEDDGPGMDETLQRRIFEPFYSTKRSGRGLGLASVLGIASAHRGAVKLESAPGEGSLFRLLVPLASRVAAHAEPPASPRPAAGPRPTVLVVDDEEGVREVAHAFLERAGFRVVPASGGREAIALLRGTPEIGAALLDLAMPDLSGPETLRALRALRPDLPVVIASGYTRDLVAERVGDDEPFGFVAKPYEADDLVAALEACLVSDSGEERALPPPAR